MRFNMPRQICISHWKVAGSLQSPKGMQSHSKNPKLPTVKAVYCLDASSIFISQTLIWDISRKNSSTYQTLQCLLYSGQRVGVLFCVSIQAQKLIQNCKLPSFFCTNTTVLHQALCLGLMATDSNISCKRFLTSSTNGRGIHLNHSLKRVSSMTFIIFSMEWVQPNQLDSMKAHHGIWPGASEQCLPALGPRNPGHLSPIHQTIYNVFA